MVELIVKAIRLGKNKMALSQIQKLYPETDSGQGNSTNLKYNYHRATYPLVIQVPEL